jgi:23S rRNA A1618 N6-methylase RlmF
MNARNRLKYVDVEELTEHQPQLNKYFRYSKTHAMRRFYDFENRDAMIAFTDALLRHYFQLSVRFDPTHLVPGVTLRLNYIHCLEDLLGLEKFDSDAASLGVSFHGIDIGTGATIIYPLLLRRLHPKLTMLATEIDRHSIQLAADNWQRNFPFEQKVPQAPTTSTTTTSTAVAAEASTSSSTTSIAASAVDGDICVLNGVEIRFVDQSTTLVRARKRNNNNDDDNYDEAVEKAELLTSVVRRDERFLFCMCNPPFFESVGRKRRRGRAEFVATEGEVATSGGEVEFALRLVDESLVLADRVRLYSIMLGVLADVTPVESRLRSLGARVEAFGTQALEQGRIIRTVVWWRIDATRSPPASTASTTTTTTTTTRPEPQIAKHNSVS